MRSTIIVQDENFCEVVSHRCLYGDTKQQSMEWLLYLKQLFIRPRALKYSGVYDMLPSSMKRFLEGCSNSEISKVLKVLSELSDRIGFDSAIETVAHALSYGTTDVESLKNLYRRLYADVPELPPMLSNPQLPKVVPMKANLYAYDTFLKKGVYPYAK